FKDFAKKAYNFNIPRIFPNNEVGIRNKAIFMLRIGIDSLPISKLMKFLAQGKNVPNIIPYAMGHHNSCKPEISPEIRISSYGVFYTNIIGGERFCHRTSKTSLNLRVLHPKVDYIR